MLHWGKTLCLSETGHNIKKKKRSSFFVAFSLGMIRIRLNNFFPLPLPAEKSSNNAQIVEKRTLLYSQGVGRQEQFINSSMLWRCKENEQEIQYVQILYLIPFTSHINYVLLLLCIYTKTMV